MKKTVIITLFILILSLMSCSDKRYSSQYWGLFDTVVDVEGYFETEEEFKRADALIHSTLSYYHNLFDIYNDAEFANLKTVNESGGKTLEVSPDLFEFLEYIKEAERMTGGACNPALGAVSSLWKEAIENRTLPNEAFLEEASRHCDINTVVLDKKNLTVTLTDPEVRLDVGAIGKGYAAKKLAEVLRENGFDNVLVNIGGNVTAIGEKKDGESWAVGIKSPTKDENAAVVEISNTNLVTSGGYERGAQIEGAYYHHIINPETLSPAAGHLSVSVMCEDGALADVLSTALFIVSLEEGQEMIKNFDGVEVLWIEPSGEKISTPGLPQEK